MFSKEDWKNISKRKRHTFLRVQPPIPCKSSLGHLVRFCRDQVCPGMTPASFLGIQWDMLRQKDMPHPCVDFSDPLWIILGVQLGLLLPSVGFFNNLWAICICGCHAVSNKVWLSFSRGETVGEGRDSFSKILVSALYSPLALDGCFLHFLFFFVRIGVHLKSYLLFNLCYIKFTLFKFTAAISFLARLWLIIFPSTTLGTNKLWLDCIHNNQLKELKV
jgi:hypothetical protein